MKIRFHALSIAVACTLGTAAYAQANGPAGATLNAIRSVNPSFVLTDSLNRTTNVENTVDASRRVIDSNNTDLDTQVANTRANASQSGTAVDAQTANTANRMSGPTQVGSQGDLVLNMSAGQPAYAQGGWYKSPAETAQSYEVNAKNSMFNGGDNYGLMRNQNAVVIGGNQIADSRIGHEQVFASGAQTQVQDVRQDKDSATQTNASSSIGTSVSK